MAGGRPTTYSAEALAQAQAYVNEFVPTNDEAIPTVAGMAFALSISKNTIHNWAKDEDKPEFLVLFEAMMARQEMMLVSGGLKTTFNPTITKLILTNHGYTDKAEVKDTTDDIDTWSDEKLDAYLAERNKS